jgi:hypothetical protein
VHIVSLQYTLMNALDVIRLYLHMCLSALVSTFAVVTEITAI